MLARPRLPKAASRCRAARALLLQSWAGQAQPVRRHDSPFLAGLYLPHEPVRTRGTMLKDFVQVDAFSDKPLYGNPAAVVFDADDIPTATMQQIAKEMNLSETVFI